MTDFATQLKALALAARYGKEPLVLDRALVLKLVAAGELAEADRSFDEAVLVGTRDDVQRAHATQDAALADYREATR